MIIVGGLGSTAGAVIGVVFVLGLAEVLNYVIGSMGGTLGSVSVLELKGFIYGLTIVLFLRFEPEGLMGIYREYKNRWVNWPFRY